MLLPASIPKLKQALNTPEIIASTNPFPILNSLPDASVAAPARSLSFIAPALPEIIIPITQTAKPPNTNRPQRLPNKSAIVSFPCAGLK